MEALKRYITPDEPFGPIDSAEITDPVILNRLFEQHNRIYQNLRKNPSIILGRRGSGKTAYLRSVFFDKQFDYYTEIRTNEALANVISVIQDMTKEGVFVETVAALWETVLWVSVFSEMRSIMGSAKECELVEAYLAKVGVRDKDTMDSILWTIADVMSERMKDKPAGVVSEVLRRFDKISFDETQAAVIGYLNRQRKTFVILLDSLDNFRLEINSVARAIEGLLKCIGAMNRPSDAVNVRFCLPAELYHKFVRLSSNPNKDFRRKLTIQWTAKELVLLAAQRYKLYLSLYDLSCYAQIKKLDTTNYSDAQKLMKMFLPEKVTNRFGVSEDIISYIMRHTQLSPRQLLMMLNTIFTYKNGNDGPMISENAVVRGIRSTEQVLINEVVNAYRPIYPNADIVCQRCFPELKKKFTLGDLQRTFRTHGKRAMESDDFFDFQRMLIQIGAIGRVISETDVYIKGLFEYTVPHELVTSTDDLYCIHPLFSGILCRENSYGNGKNQKFVYPYGAEVEDEDYRDEDL